MAALLRIVTLLLVLCAAAPLWARDAQPIPDVTLAALPPEAAQTLALIRRGPPFPFKRDGITFHNREGRLPAQPRGYYREFTVPTPGRSDRGAKRIIAGAGGEFYYTADHYRSFMRIRQ